MASLTPQVSTGVNPAFGQALSGIGSNGNAQTYFQPQAPNFLQQPTVNNSNVAQALMGTGPLTNAPTPTATGGTSFNPSHAAAYTAPVAQQTASQPQGLGSFLTNTQGTPGGGQITTSQNGSPTGYTPSAGYSIPTSGVNSDSFNSGTSMSDVMNKQKTLQDYVNGLAQANGYDPQYLQAYQQTQQAQAQGAQLGLNAAQYGVNSANINNQFYNGGPNIPGGATVDYLSGITAKAQAANTLGQAGNTLAQGENQVQQLSANQALNTAQLARTGNIASTQAQLQYSPGSITQQNAISQYNSLQQQYPGANLPPIDPNQDLFGQLQNAHQIIAQSPAYQAGFQSTYQTPGGGTGIYNKLNVQGLQQDQNGNYTLVPAAAAVLGAANADVVKTQLSNLSNINSAINASTKTLDTTQQFMNQYGLNQSGVSILSQIQNSTNKQLNKAGAVAGLNADLNALRADYAQYLVGRGGSIAGTNEEANKAIPDTISPAQLQILVKEMQTVGANTAGAVSQQVNQALSGITNNSVGQQQTQGGSLYDF